MIMHLWCHRAYEIYLGKAHKDHCVNARWTFAWLVNVSFWWCWLWWHFTKMVASFKYKMRALRALASLLSTSSSKGTCKCSNAHVFQVHICSCLQVDIEGGKFLEHGEFKGNLYGTSTDGIRELIGAGFQPILTPHFQVRWRWYWESVQLEALGIVLCPN